MSSIIKIVPVYVVLTFEALLGRLGASIIAIFIYWSRAMEEMLELSTTAVLLVAGGADDANRTLLSPDWPGDTVQPMIGSSNQFPTSTPPNPPR